MARTLLRLLRSGICGACSDLYTHPEWRSGSGNDTRQGRRGYTMKIALMVIGVLALLVGLLWIGQGTGLVAWPPSSFMIDQRPWALRGALLAIVGVLAIWYTRRRPA